MANGNAGVVLGQFILGLLKGKESKKKLDKEKAKKQKEQQKELKEQNKAKIDFYKSKANNLEGDAKRYALDMVSYYQGIGAGIPVTKPTANKEIEDLMNLGSVPDDPEIVEQTKAGKDLEEYSRAKKIREDMITWYRGLDIDEKEKLKDVRGFEAKDIPSIETLMKNVNLYEQQLSELKKQEDTQTEVVTREKAEMEQAKSKMTYRESFEDQLEYLFATLQYTQNLRNDPNPDATKMLQRINDMRSRTKYSKPIVGEITNEQLDDLYDKLVVYERLFGEKYQAADRMWDAPIIDPDSADSMTIGQKDDIRVAAKGTSNQTTAAISLRDMYDKLAYDQDGNVVESVNSFLETKYPKIYKQVNIVTKETDDYENALAKREELHNQIQKMYSSFLNVSMANKGFVPQKDARKTITDNRKEIGNPTYNQDVPVDNPNYSTAIENPFYDEKIADDKLKNNEPYIDEREFVDDGLGGQMPNPYFNKRMQKEILDYRKKIFKKDDRKFINNPTYGKDIENPGYDLEIVQYPYLSTEQD